MRSDINKLPMIDRDNSPKIPRSEEHEAERMNSSSARLNQEQWSITLEEFLRVVRNATKLQEELFNHPLRKGLHDMIFSHRAMEDCYNLVCQVLTKHYALTDYRTSAVESKFFHHLKQLTKGRAEIFTQLWIGPGNVDFFLPWSRTNKSLGVIIEVGGHIYDNRIKAIKFDHKDKYVAERFRIPIMFIENDRASYKQASKIVDNLLASRPIGTNTKKRLLTRIYIDTIATWIDRPPLHQHRDRIFQDIFGLKYEQMCELKTLVCSMKRTRRLEKYSENSRMRDATSQHDLLTNSSTENRGATRKVKP